MISPLALRLVFVVAVSMLPGSGAASAGVPIDRTILPIPPRPYVNQIGTSYRDSTSQIQPTLSAPPGAPNIVLILLDDAGYGQTSTFGAPIPTPTLDRLAAEGLRYTRFNVTALCSPSRAALLTGRNNHSVGMGIVTRYSTGFPGYDGNMPKSAALISETLRQNGYSTAAFGKWHLIPEWETGPAGPFDHWPTGQGFDYFYGFLFGETDQWNPELHEGTRLVSMDVPPGREADYTLNESLSDKAQAWIRQQKSVAPDRPFFLYFAPGAIHAPLQAPKAWIDRFKGQFDQGWDHYREMTFARQKELGVIPADAKLTPRPAELAAWDSLSPDQRKVSARMMEVLAGFMAQTDHEIGRMLDTIRDLGQSDNTLVVFIAGDNGASLQGDSEGKFSLQVTGNGVHETTEDLLGRLDELGSATSSPQYPTGWAWAGNTPFQWGKQFASHLGGTRAPLVVSWPGRIRAAGGIRGQYHHLIDIVPTLFEAAGVPAPTQVNGVVQMPVDGVSMLYTFDDASAADRRTTQYYETFGNRSIYHDGWLAGARGGRIPWIRTGDFDFDKQPWELHHIGEDYSQATDLAAAEPERLEAMRARFMQEARRFQVLPIDPRSNERISPKLRPSLTPGRTTFTYYGPPLNLFDNLAPPVRNESYTIEAEIVVPAGGADGVIVADGGAMGGYSLFVKGGRIHYLYNFVGRELTLLAAGERLPPGPATVALRFDYDGGGRGKGGRAVLAVNGMPVAEQRVPRTAPTIFYWYETFDLGEDLGTPVGDYRSPFRFPGKIGKVTVEITKEGSSGGDEAPARGGKPRPQ
jgi:arylsulfatase A-like enzyme